MTTTFTFYRHPNWPGFLYWKGIQCGQALCLDIATGCILTCTGHDATGRELTPDELVAHYDHPPFVPITVELP